MVLYRGLNKEKSFGKYKDQLFSLNFETIFHRWDFHKSYLAREFRQSFFHHFFVQQYDLLISKQTKSLD